MCFRSDGLSKGCLQQRAPAEEIHADTGKETHDARFEISFSVVAACTPGDAAFHARYGLVIREASQRSITLVDSLLSTAPIFLGLLGLAVTLFALAPLLVLAMVAISIPASLVERRFSGAMYELQEHNAPNQLRMAALTNMPVEASWHRHIPLHHTDIIAREH